MVESLPLVQIDQYLPLDVFTVLEHNGFVRTSVSVLNGGWFTTLGLLQLHVNLTVGAAHSEK